ncbi:MAG TPA: TRCF domain-containing protein, partial [bacterium]
YYVHNKVQNIHREAARLRELAPQARVRIGHGQMSASELEAVMLDFYEGQYDILLCTTIIESGLDIPNVNTIIINDADHFGLSQLHQLRGRVGRGSRQAYCFLLTKPYKQLTEAAEKRLSALREFTDLGAGFQIAMRDLEIRGAGNLLGAEQHGNIAAVGFDLYCQMLEEEVKALQGEPPDERLLPAVSLPVPTLIPEGYVPTEGLRIACYRKIAACKTELDVDGVQAELQDRFGDPPASVWNLLRIIRLRIRCVGAGVARIEADARQATLWLAGKLDRIAVRDLHREFRRARLLPDRVVLHYDGPALRPVEELVDALQRFGGKSAAEAVQKQLRAAEHLEAATGQSR